MPTSRDQITRIFLVHFRSKNHYLSTLVWHHETPRKQARNRSQGDLDTARGPNPPFEKAKWDQIPFLQHMYIYIFIYLHYVDVYI